MMCREYRGDLIEAVRGGAWPAALRVHVDQCAECAQFLEEQQALSEAMAGLRGEDLPAADEFARRVMLEFDRARGARSQAWRWVLAAGLAAALCLALVRVGTPPPSAVQQPPFLTIPYTVPLAPEEPATVAQIEIPESALIAAGFHVQPSDPTALVKADVLIGQDGRVRAIRPISVSNSD